ncbi:MAG: butyrate kinase [Thermoanaerobacteraceae bacterium]|jgi:butyrate kinase|uniref:Probable butyrate kinase n=1 Tax=Biomaibacter acetigenes TaxID=2316383 RepID=A0A3G2R7K2_9FIRM|nr:butyrate kinase [Biomaibacter acetigenes]AYO31355.1 butyrate kinase [Biomaibacter acetigenes]MDK2878528.1 butyrate kinase [Thermoanaerobacteraceae bacterium]
MKKFKILAINPGSTSTKISVFYDEMEVFSQNILHDYEELKKFESVLQQKDLRCEAVERCLKDNGYDIRDFDVVVARGGILHPVKAGTYDINHAMLEDLRNAAGGEHPSNVAAFMAVKIAGIADIPAFIVDPVSVDEMKPVARVSGFKGIERKSLSHALNMRRVAFRVAEELKRPLEELNFIVAHLGGGISIAAMEKGLLIDVESANCMGPFSPERCGGLPILDLVDLCYSGRYSRQELKRKLIQEGGVYSYLGTKDVREAIMRAESGDEEAALVLEAMVYQISKVIGEMASVLKGRVDRIILTGGIAYSELICRKIEERVGFIAKLEIVPGEEEMKALAEAALRVLTGRENIMNYTGREGICSEVSVKS